MTADVTDSSYSAWPAINRKAIGAMAGIGALETAFLTYQKLNPAGLDLLCGASGGCLDVLNGPYSNVLVSEGLWEELFIPRVAVCCSTNGQDSFRRRVTTGRVPP